MTEQVGSAPDQSLFTARASNSDPVGDQAATSPHHAKEPKNSADILSSQRHCEDINRQFYPSRELSSPILAFQTASDTLLRDIIGVLEENKAYQLAVIEQQNQLHDCLSDLNRSLQVNRLERHAEVEELHSQVDGLRQDLNRFFVGPTYGPEHRPEASTRTRRRRPRRPRRAQTPGPIRRSPHPVDSSEDSLEPGVDPNLYRYAETTAPIRGSYTPASTHPVIPSARIGATRGSSRAVPRSNNLRFESRPEQSSQRSSGLSYVTDNPVIPPPPPGFVPYPGQDPVHRQNPFPTPRASSRQSPFHSTPVPPPPQMQHHRTSDESQWA